MRALGPGAAFRESLALFMRRPLATLALGLALLTSLVAVCCGLGVVAAPWFLGELFALQIALGTGVRVVRTRAWFWAFAVQMVAVLILCAVVGLTVLSLGPDIVVGGSQNTASLASGVLRSIGLWIVAGGLTLVLVVYFEHVPALLLDRGGPLTAAMLESARLVAESGLLRTWFTSGIAHGLQLAPIVIGLSVAAAFGTLSSTVIWALFLLPLAALSLALGQGMVVASYLALRPHALDPARVPKQARLSTSRALLWTTLLLCVLSGPLTVSGALLRPAQPRPGTPAQDGDVIDSFVATAVAKERFVANTALTLQVSEARVRVKASDGGGAGTIPLPHVAVVSVRVLRPSTLPDEIRREGLGTSIFALEIALRDGRKFTTWIDDAGVRLDDSLTRRLSSLVPPWMMMALVGCLVWTAIWVSLALPPQGRLRKRLSEHLSASDDHPSVSGELDRLLRRSALRAAAWLAPPAFASLAIGLWAALGKGTLWP